MVLYETMSLRWHAGKEREPKGENIDFFFFSYGIQKETFNEDLFPDIFQILSLESWDCSRTAPRTYLEIFKSHLGKWL